MSIVGGANTAEATRRMMASLIFNELATKFNWQGKGAKRGFGKLLLAGILLRTYKIDDCVLFICMPLITYIP